MEGSKTPAPPKPTNSAISALILLTTRQRLFAALGSDSAVRKG